MKIENLMETLPKTYSYGDRELILRAFRVADQAHEGQKRASGEPYISHCLAVAYILADLRVPPPVVAAGLLHDTVEDTSLTIEDIKRDFGGEIAILVDGVTKLTQLPRVSRGDQHPDEAAQEEIERKIAERRGMPDPEIEATQITRSRRYDIFSETIRKTFFAMGDDVRVVLIKLADRLHNLRTLSHMPENKRKRIARETLDIFAPLANRLGIWQIKWELEDLAFRHVDPTTYKEIAEQIAERREDREREISEQLSQSCNRFYPRRACMRIYRDGQNIFIQSIRKCAASKSLLIWYSMSAASGSLSQIFQLVIRLWVSFIPIGALSRMNLMITSLRQKIIFTNLCILLSF